LEIARLGDEDPSSAGPCVDALDIRVQGVRSRADAAAGKDVQQARADDAAGEAAAGIEVGGADVDAAAGHGEAGAGVQRSGAGGAHVVEGDVTACLVEVDVAGAAAEAADGDRPGQGVAEDDVAVAGVGSDVGGCQRQCRGGADAGLGVEVHALRGDQAGAADGAVGVDADLIARGGGGAGEGDVAGAADAGAEADVAPRRRCWRG